MKHKSAPDIWEKKKHLIIDLYKHEGWPVKQVIKKVRTGDFNPSDGQLRSRLKKWGITKFPRQRKVKNSVDMNRVVACNTGKFKHTIFSGEKPILPGAENEHSDTPDIRTSTNCSYGLDKAGLYIQYTEPEPQFCYSSCAAIPPTICPPQPGDHMIPSGYYTEWLIRVFDSTSRSEYCTATAGPAAEGVEVVNWPWPLRYSMSLDPRLQTPAHVVLSYQSLGHASDFVAERVCPPSGLYDLPGMAQ
ncbi:hypothetical protein BDV33DRAFT_209698 [Aspergillus novoparasiticus]|uniref:Clr5 domain-containing protein n=1 Tax=Aspergillus novoparasiticus TaxID=986946 RepID=A0A5N6EB11_9EURO|nr:hypothetical protein BDV33DRAFT_209698 [Aspergillus novoparasiticus]